jgi:hypothetical protein
LTDLIRDAGGQLVDFALLLRRGRQTWRWARRGRPQRVTDAR